MKIPWRRTWQPTPVFLSGEFHGKRSLAGYSPWGHKGVGHDLVTITPTQPSAVSYGLPALWSSSTIGAAFFQCMVCRIIASKDTPVLISRTCDYVSLHGKRGFPNMAELRLLRRNFPGLSKRAQCNSKGPYNMEARELKKKRDDRGRDWSDSFL